MAIMSEDERARIAALSIQGLEHERAGEYERALAAFRASVAIAPTYCDHYNAGNMLLALDRPSEALDEYERSIACKDDYAEAHCNRGIALTRIDRHSDARVAFERAIAVAPRLENAHRCYAILLQRMGDHAAEVAARRQLTVLDPGSAHAWLELAAAIKRSRGKDDRFIDSRPGGVEDEIIDALERGLALGVTDSGLLGWAWAEKLIRLGRVTAASGRLAQRYLEAAEQAVRQFPDDEWFAGKLENAREFF